MLVKQMAEPRKDEIRGSSYQNVENFIYFSILCEVVALTPAKILNWLFIMHAPS
jgi:hypothetical protein